MKCAVCSEQWAMYSVQSAICYAKRSVFSMHCVVFSVELGDFPPSVARARSSNCTHLPAVQASLLKSVDHGGLSKPQEGCFTLLW